MKKQIAKNLSVFLVIVFVGLLILTYCFQRREIEKTEQTSALSTLSGIQEILEVNDADLENLTASLRDEYIIKAQMAAYITQNMTQVTESDYRELATLLGVDEVHVFNDEGVIYTGSESKYWGYSFDSGAQMRFFEPLLTDKSLIMCQDITPNTAEDKPMMYIAVWQDNGENIVQIGIEPERIIEAQRKNELSYIFDSMPTDGRTVLLAVDATTGMISGSSEETYVDVSAASLGLVVNENCANGNYFYTNIEDEPHFCVFTTYQDTYIGVVLNETEINTAVREIMVLFAVCFMVAMVLFYCILIQIILRWILNDVKRLIDQVGQITGGNLDTTVDVGTSPEFRELCHHLNDMVSSLLNTTAKMSHVLDYVDTNIAVYEYKRDMNRVFATRKLGELLDITPEELQILTSHKVLFEGKIRAVKSNTTEEPRVYSLDGEKFLKIETLEINEDEYGVVVDISDTVHEKMRLEYERDYDLLTNIYNRRAFFREMDQLYARKYDGKEAVILALDLDNLKTINDTYGHDGGDKAIQTATDLLKQIPMHDKILARMGGDEFMLVLYGADDRATLMRYIHGLEGQLKLLHVAVAGDIISVQMSAGYVFCGDSEEHYEELLKQADQALYCAKVQGKNKFLPYQGLDNGGC